MQLVATLFVWLNVFVCLFVCVVRIERVRQSFTSCDNLKYVTFTFLAFNSSLDMIWTFAYWGCLLGLLNHLPLNIQCFSDHKGFVRLLCCLDEAVANKWVFHTGYLLEAWSLFKSINTVCLQFSLCGWWNMSEQRWSSMLQKLSLFP